MIVRFWGVRGSIPTPMTSEEIAAKVERAIRRTIDHDFGSTNAVQRFMEDLPRHAKGTYGGNTPCVEIEHEDPNSRIVFDAGTGIRGLGLHLMKNGFASGDCEIHLFLSHTHWDHIQGFPFFPPAFVPGNRITIYGSKPDMEARLSTQQDTAFFPVSLQDMQAQIRFVHLAEGETFHIGDTLVRNVGLHHPGGSHAFRIESKGASFVYASDTEFTDFSEINVDQYLSFFSKADALVFDCQYTLQDAMKKEDWGHSSSLKGVDLAHEAGVRMLVLFHHEPTYDDRALWELLQTTRKYADMLGLNNRLEIIMAYEGLELEI